MQRRTAKGLILPKATCFINASAGLLSRETLQCRIFFFTLSEIHALKRVYNAMKLHATPTQHYQTVTAYDDEGVEINAVRFTQNIIVMPEMAPVTWPVASFDALTNEHFEQIEATKPDVVILGTGKRQRFVHPRLTTSLSARHVGVECMDSQAACRTYNILMTEGRRVALALIFD